LTKVGSYVKVTGMNRRITILSITLLFIFVSVDVHAFWIWTPETKRWINPKYSAKENARLQLAEVEKFYNSEQYKLSLREAKKLVSYFPRAREAAKGQFYIGLCLEKLGKYYDAYKAYQKGIEKYPFSQDIMEMTRRQYEIGKMFLEGQVKQSMGSFLVGDEPAIEIFNSVLENAPYSEFAASSQYKLGLALLKIKRLYEANEAFQKVLDDYPNSEWVESAKYQIAVVTAKVSGGFAYDQASTVSARKQFEGLLESYPDAQFSQEAKQRAGQLKEEEAEGHYKIARFYKKQKAFESARIYYQYVIDNYPASKWAGEARKQLLELEGKK